MGSSARRKKRKTKIEEKADDDTPRILVMKRGTLSYEMKQLSHDLRLILSPNCVIHMKEKPKRKLKDFIGITDVLNLTHLIVLTQSNSGSYIRVSSLPSGPTLTFSVGELTLISDVTKHSKNPQSIGPTLKYSPLLVLNGFSGGSEQQASHSDNTDNEVQYPYVKTVASVFSKIFAPIDIYATKIQNCRRVVLLHRDKDTETISFRHYLINLVDCCTAPAVQNLIDKRSAKRIVDKNKDFKQIIDSTFRQNMDSPCQTAESYEIIELDNLDPSEVINKKKYGIGNKTDEKSIDSGTKVALRLTDTGPRLSLTLIKIQEGVFGGTVKYHNSTKRIPRLLGELESRIAEKHKRKKIKRGCD